MAKRKCKSCKNEVESTAEFCPMCGNKFKKKNLFLFSIIMLILFVIVLEFLFPITMVIFQHGMAFGKYGESALLELLLLAFVLVVLLLSGNGYVFSDKRKGFFSSLLVGLPMLIFSSFILFTTFFSIFDNFKLANLISLVFLCILVGLAEEFLCRAWLQNEFIERFGSTKKGIILSILVSSLVFGLMHITNLFATPQGFVDTLMQVIQALASGFLFGSIYYRTKNIWTVAFLHGFFDFSLMLGEVNTLKGCVSAEYTTGALIISTIASIFLMLFYVFSGIYALSTEGKPEIFKDRTKAMVISIVALIVSITLFFVFSFITGGSDDTICYEFNEKEISEYYDVATTDRTMFSFGNNDYNYYLKTNDDELTLSINKESVTLTFEESIQEYMAIDNSAYVDLIINCYEGENVIYFERLEKVDFEDSKEYLEKVKNNFKKIDVPDLKSIGYVVFDYDSTKYPYFLAYGDEEFFIDLDEELYMIKKAKGLE